ncbi:hypothetical protein [Streptomyces varsoviensis]|uniref:hypothetical protein n=1 Tax=Streptomyces varsoviensis TaxID=67373 RepID=UPI0012FF3E04|nr:hypothetical protein [Streptomyces varsoviensis]
MHFAAATEIFILLFALIHDRVGSRFSRDPNSGSGLSGAVHFLRGRYEYSA